MNAQAIFSTASRHYQKGQYTDALNQLNALMELNRDAKTFVLLAKVLSKLGFKQEAARAYQLAGEAGGSRAEDYLTEAMKLYFANGNEDEALSIGLPLLEKAKTDADIAFIIASIFLKRGEKAILGLFKAPLTLSTNRLHNALAFKLLTAEITDLQDRDALTNLFRNNPKNTTLRSAYLVYAREANDFAEVEKHDRDIQKALKAGQTDFLAAEAPYYHATWCGDERLNHIAGAHLRPFPPSLTEARRSTPHRWGERIRIGYVSSDFWDDHATMKLLKAVLMAHDRKRFDVTLFCHTNSAHAARDRDIREKWGRIVEIGDLTDEQAAEVIRRENIDILVDLKGHTLESRVSIFNQAAAPVQVGWLGFPGTTVNVDLDYVIGDPYVLPDASKAFYYEKYCRLPETYQPNDPYGRPRPEAVSRRTVGLPEDAFVFASFNANRKISLQTVNLWIDILRQTPESLLWLMCDRPDARSNLLAKFKSAGIDLKRIIICPKVRYQDHVNRVPLADIGLDTYPYNGHTTTSEQLWSGLPVLTFKGTNFASRVSESLLNAIGVPELVAAGPEDYVQEAVALYNNRDKIAAYRKTLEDNRFQMPLFDAERFCLHLEKGYEMMADRAKRGLAPDHIDVPALPARTGSFER
ncbi:MULTISPECIES: glycosyl transferase [unclassified Ensifer]|uniref:O-linked N-acetylglucosamine transferase, SPINDLY family protein n=1 Tax=unclassified Ensifer TaxID=2633371 RepID=UPI00081353C5|nr:MULTISPECIES: glycosyl transferase [unclassified Ensifer]OCP04935.1 glycosyl transferase [Ensifer sp. LC14]OCP11906.1 glycosyl transferase [Ensifer sp. LC13]OCP12475.1 glycosyl transferase [Ensifer sp. LC11]OCP33570.1 glycosyl transferase [Ensifer sp. LC499]